jgi:hypothetical protein
LAKNHQLYRGAVNHGADPILIHQRVSGPYPAWSRVSERSSIPSVWIVTNFHQSRFFVDFEKICDLIHMSLWTPKSIPQTFRLARRCIQRANPVSNQGNPWERCDTPPESTAINSLFCCGENGARCVGQTWPADKSRTCRPN